jgi:hypothetical protein
MKQQNTPPIIINIIIRIRIIIISIRTILQLVASHDIVIYSDTATRTPHDET